MLHSDHQHVITDKIIFDCLPKVRQKQQLANVCRLAHFLNIFFFKEYSPILKIMIGESKWKILSSYQKCFFLNKLSFFCEVHDVHVTYKCNTRQVIGNLVML